MDAELKPTVASELAFPVTQALVELEELKTRDGAKASVLCYRCDQLHIVRQLGMPGAFPGAVAEAGRPSVSIGHTERMLLLAPHLVHTATAFVNTDGSEVRPAFHCDAAHQVPGSFPWDLVPMDDKLRVISGLLRLSGFGGAADFTFLRRQRSGDGNGMGTVASVEGAGEDAPRSSE